MSSDHERDDPRSFAILAEQAGDPRVVVNLIRQKIAELNNNGEEVPEELIWIQNHYVDECIYSPKPN